MGLIKTLKEILNKNIECGSEIDNNIVYHFKKKKYLYLDKNIYVREKTACVIVYKYKVCDVIMEGKYRINQESIPETYSRAKIEKMNKNGSKPKKIRVDIYFVNLNTFRYFPYESDVPFRVKSGELGRVKGFLEGNCSVKVLDAGALIKALIIDTGKAKTKEVPEDIGLWIGNKINSLIEKHKIPPDLLLSNQSYVEEIVNTDMVDALDKIGLFVTNVKLKALNFPKKYQSKVNAYIGKHNKNVNRVDIKANFEISSTPNVHVPVEKKVATNYNTMQKVQRSINIQEFKECSKCGKINSAISKICINCGNKLN